MDTLPTDTHRLAFLMNPLVPMEDAKVQQEARLKPTWWYPEKQQKFHTLVVQVSEALRSSQLGPTLRPQLVDGYLQDLFRTPENLAAAAKRRDQPARYGTLVSQTMAANVAPGVIRALGFSGRPTGR